MGAALARFLDDRSGVTGIEYGVIALGVSLVIVSAAGAAGQHLKDLLRLVAALTTSHPALAH
jgi:Flp pilus assembly pilin Flp